MSTQNRKQNRKLFPMLVTLALLIAIEIILSRFLSIAQWNIKFSFAFIPVVIAGILFGPIASAAVSGISDFLGAILFPIGAYFPGFTLTSMLTGFVFGFFLYKKQSLGRIIAATMINQVFGSLLLNSYWLSIISGTSFFAQLSARSVQVVAMSIVTIVVVQLISKELMPRLRHARAHE